MPTSSNIYTPQALKELQECSEYETWFRQTAYEVANKHLTNPMLIDPKNSGNPKIINTGYAMEMINVISKAIKAVGYDSSTQRMKIQFIEGKTYDFCNVPQRIFDGLRQASSKGTYYHDHIRDHYHCF